MERKTYLKIRDALQTKVIKGEMTCGQATLLLKLIEEAIK